MAARGVTLSPAIQPAVAACAVVRFYTLHRQDICEVPGHPLVKHRYVWANTAAVGRENIGGVTLDLAMGVAKLAKLAMAARGVTLSLAVQSPVTVVTVVQ